MLLVANVYAIFFSTQGLQICEKQRVSPWDILEGHKNPAPLSWSWFGAIRLERKPLWFEENHRLLKYHTHSMVRTPVFYMEPPPLPPEDLEPPVEKPVSLNSVLVCDFCLKITVTF